MYKTNQQCWDEVQSSIDKSSHLSMITQRNFKQDNFKGLSQEQINKVYEIYTKQTT